jgi:hypothetical protein
MVASVRRATRLPVAVREHTGDVAQERMQRERAVVTRQTNVLLGRADTLDEQVADLQARVASLETIGFGSFGRVGHLTLPMGNVNVTLTAEQARYYMLAVTGAHTAIRTITFPAPATEEQTYQRLVWNFTSGGFAVRLSIGSGTTFDVPNGALRHVVIITTGVFIV